MNIRPGHIAILLAIVVPIVTVTVTMVSSCATTGQIPGDVAAAVVDCTASQFTSLEAEFEPVVTSAIEAAWDGSKINWSSLNSLFGTLAADGWCVVEQTVADLAKVATANTPAISTKLGPDFAHALATGIADLRVKKFGSKTFHVK